jgi:hypothetical protein
MIPPKHKEKLRELFFEGFVKGKETLHLGWGIARKDDANVIADWWLSKLEERDQEIVKAVEGMKKGEINPDTGMPYYSDYWTGVKDGYNQALEDIIALINNK